MMVTTYLSMREDETTLASGGSLSRYIQHEPHCKQTKIIFAIITFKFIKIIEEFLFDHIVVEGF